MPLPPHACFTPESTDILGIGTRIHLYAQCFLIVLISVIVRARKGAPDLVWSLWRLQFYTSCAFAIAGIYERVQGQLSVFHAAAAYHIGTLFIWSAMVGWKIQKPGDGVHYALLGNKQTNCSHISRFLTKHMILLGCGFINIAVGIIVILDSRCGEATQTIVVWKFMFGLTAIINVDPSSRSALFVFGFVVFPIVLFVVIPLLLNATIACFSPKSSIYNKFLYPFLYLFFWVEEIIAIEQSIKANPELDHQAENRWNFGQIITLVLLMPYIERILAQIGEMLLQYRFIAKWYRRILSDVFGLHTQSSKQKSRQEPDESVRMDLIGDGENHPNVY